LADFNAAGFDFFQIHFRHDLPATQVAAWAETVGVDRLWLAPKLPPAVDVPPTLLPLAKHFLLDTFHADKFGGTGATGDWEKFARHQRSHADKTWILSGGLNPDNIGAALRSSGARFVDVNSGVESAPGIKDQEKLKRFVVRLHESRS
jgi:phosphoribosylanthranilate isomerase